MFGISSKTVYIIQKCVTLRKCVSMLFPSVFNIVRKHDTRYTKIQLVLSRHEQAFHHEFCADYQFSYKKKIVKLCSVHFTYSARLFYLESYII